MFCKCGHIECERNVYIKQNECQRHLYVTLAIWCFHGNIKCFQDAFVSGSVSKLI